MTSSLRVKPYPELSKKRRLYEEARFDTKTLWLSAFMSNLVQTPCVQETCFVELLTLFAEYLETFTFNEAGADEIDYVRALYRAWISPTEHDPDGTLRINKLTHSVKEMVAVLSLLDEYPYAFPDEPFRALYAQFKEQENVDTALL